MDLLTPVATRTVKRPQSLSASAQTSRSTYTSIDSPETTLKALKDQPDFETVGRVLNYLISSLKSQDGFSIAIPGPLSSQIINTLVTTTLPDYWRTFRESRRHCSKLIKCLKNVSSLGAIMSRLRPLIADCRRKKPVDQTRDPSQHVEDLLEVLGLVLEEDQTSFRIWTDIQDHVVNSTQRSLMWKEYISLSTSGKILSMAAQAEDALKERGNLRKEVWLSNGNEYASWLGRNIAAIIVEIAPTEYLPLLSQFCGRALSLGYNDRVVSSILTTLLEKGSVTPLADLLPKLAVHEQRQLLNSAITFLSKQYFSFIDKEGGLLLKSQSTISGAAYVVHELIRNNDVLRDHVVSLLTSSTISALNDSYGTRRSVIAAIAEDKEKLQTVAEKSLELFGDKFYMIHTPILQQEALAQILTIACGYVHRSEPLFLTMITKSSTHSSTISNRIAASSPRARLLGMFVGVAISLMVDKPELRLKFEFEGSEAEEAKWYQQLTTVEDKIGQLGDLKPLQSTNRPTAPTKASKASKQKAEAPTKPSITEIKGPRIIEIVSESSDEDEDLVPYGKPDSDPEDEDDDPTVLDRHKPTAPVYIRDLLAHLRDHDNYDRQLIALQTAAPLIRRKSNFGTEVTDHIEELASILVSLNDNFDLLNFAELRQQALIAVLLAKPGPMAQWFVRSFFSGDYSLTQRIAMLTTLGLGARELAGFNDPSETPIPIPTTPSFPSKTLPPRLHKLYAAETGPVAALTAKLEKTTLEPMALSAADKLSGPDILKVRTFSSRMDIEKRRKKPVPNKLAQVVAENFFFPLTGRWWGSMQSSTSSHSPLISTSILPSTADEREDDNLYTSPHLLPPFLQTLAILINASGPSTLSLPQMTREMWELLLSVRGIAMGDKSILKALLFAFLMLIETNEDGERLAVEQGREVVETQEWVRGVFENLGGGKRMGAGDKGEEDEDEKVRALAAGVLVRLGEVVEKYRRRMVGSLMDY
ncbi:hypothetical protein GQ43DRAFT_484297 [Delitschia confertaspora ATCC 74209]|uniref:Telomere length regulation protein conserved domain-containing protein n=1 Tax=Delitschia confertaspora ATCC 74209 TaxID=1513339 RepID=A0A9P4JIQ8_9PLEO|nr:hypothetical protein GQ43DRAFT_484297 [Delitschia confertaspora ATCC 74209]